MKSYGQFCGVARALDVVGERWTLLIVRDLILGPRTFSQLERALQPISPSMLSQRLRQLEEAALMERTSGRRYALTDTGRALEPVVLSLGAFGAQYLDQPRPDDQLDTRWAMLSLKRRFRGARTTGAATLRVGSDCFAVDWSVAHLQVRDSAHASATTTLAGEQSAWFAMLQRLQSLGALEDAGAITIDGDGHAARDLLQALGADTAG